jgi:hypothetical protein
VDKKPPKEQRLFRSAVFARKRSDPPDPEGVKPGIPGETQGNPSEAAKSRRKYPAAF